MFSSNIARQMVNQVLCKTVTTRSISHLKALPVIKFYGEDCEAAICSRTKTGQTSKKS